jgi:3-hydroxyacyl-CoA dehydrogenase
MRSAKASDATVRNLIEQASEQRGIMRRTLAPEEIQRRALLAMVNEAALLLEDEIASRPSDVDVVLVQGYGFPRWEGGPVFWAQRQDRARLEAELASLAREAGNGLKLADLDPLYA